MMSVDPTTKRYINMPYEGITYPYLEVTVSAHAQPNLASRRQAINANANYQARHNLHTFIYYH